MIQTAATLFSGGGGSDIGLKQAGLEVRWGIEKDADIVEVAQKNDLPIRQADITEEDPLDWADVDVLHASPPCPSFSVAKTGAAETDEDVSLARATARFIRGIQPKVFTLENVWGYRKSESWKLIRQCLHREGYDWNAWKLNAADYGVPQTRKRMIVAAIRGGLRPTKPTPTHTEDPKGGGLFGGEKKGWVGWYEAIEDLIPDLPESELADWQKERLPDNVTSTLFYGNDQRDTVSPTSLASDKDEPCGVVKKDQERAIPRAVLCGTNSVSGGAPRFRGDDTPALSQRPNDDGRLRAILVKGSAVGSGEKIDDGPEVPAGVVKKETGQRDPWRAVLVGNNPNRTSGAKVFKDTEEPGFAQRGGTGGRAERVVLGRYVVQLTPRCLARFQTVPDWYRLPDTKSLACTIVGNMVPPLLQKRVALSVIRDC